MVEHENSINRHSGNDALSLIADSWDVPNSTSEGLKDRKTDLLQKLGLLDIPSPYRKDRRFEGIYGDLPEHLRGELSNNQRVSCRLVTPIDLPGNYPTAHFSSVDQLEDGLKEDDEGNVLIRTVTGDYVNTKDLRYADTFSRRNSESFLFSHLTNFEDPIRVKAGGGFRMEARGVRTVEGKEIHDFRFISLFADLSPRLTNNLSKVPHTVFDFSVEYRDAAFVPLFDQPDLEKMLTGDLINAKEFTKYSVSHLFQQSGEELARLFRGLYSLDPDPRTHSVEGHTSLTKDGFFSEIIDFDSIEWVEKSKQNAGGDNVVNFEWEKLRKHLTELQIRKEVSLTSSLLEDYPELKCHADEITSSLYQLVGSNDTTFLPMALARLQQGLFPKFAWEPTQSERVSIHHAKDITLYKLGFYPNAQGGNDLSFIYLFESGNLIDPQLHGTDAMNWIRKNGTNTFTENKIGSNQKNNEERVIFSPYIPEAYIHFLRGD